VRWAPEAARGANDLHLPSDRRLRNDLGNTWNVCVCVCVCVWSTERWDGSNAKGCVFVCVWIEGMEALFQSLRTGAKFRRPGAKPKRATEPHSGGHKGGGASHAHDLDFFKTGGIHPPRAIPVATTRATDPTEEEGDEASAGQALAKETPPPAGKGRGKKGKKRRREEGAGEVALFAPKGSSVRANEEGGAAAAEEEDEEGMG
jgi:hypothetical protein